MRKLIAIGLALGAVAPVLAAQSPGITPEVRPFVGVSVPTGAQRDLFKDAAMFGLQTALELRPTVHLVGTFGWVPGESKYTVAENNVQLFQYDIGAEVGLQRMLGAWEFKPFIGVGGGARTYVYSASQLGNKTCSAGYGALGAELQMGRAALRLEGRDNVFCYRSPIAGVPSKTRNDIGLSLGLAYHIR
jgi:hypothetical protein